MSKLIPVENVQSRILLLRGQKVIVDADLALLYGVSTKRLNEQVKRNLPRFPDDFLIQLTSQEKEEVVANCDHLQNLKFSSGLPYAFTEHGALMVSSILNTHKAIEMGIFIIRAFVSLREFLLNHQKLAYKLAESEMRIENHDQNIQSLWSAIEELKREPEEKLPKVKGFEID
ncbi:hypothetical protein BVX98_01755 [bacterium F11]|nr:hypothetical protein BVX98_01755 [bacterium F11]